MDERETEKRNNSDQSGSPDTAGFGGDSPATKDWASINVVDRLLSRLETQLTTDGFKASIGDFIRLLEYRKKIEGDSVKEMYVAWAESSKTESVSAQ